VTIPSPRRLRRQHNLERLIAEAGGASVLARDVGTPPSHISTLRSGKRGVGDELAAKLERRYRKPAGWMDEPPPSEETAALPAARNLEEAELLEGYRWLTDAERAELVADVTARARRYQEVTQRALRLEVRPPASMIERMQASLDEAHRLAGQPTPAEVLQATAPHPVSSASTSPMPRRPRAKSR
jgi:hypothetical protein